MTVKIEITGENADVVRSEMAALLAIAIGISAPQMSEVSSDTAEAKTGEMIPPPPVEPTRRGRKKATVTDVVNTAPTETVFPPGLPVAEAVAVTPAQQAIDAQMDAADEAEDTAKARDPEKPLTTDDVKAEIAKYIEKWTYAAAKWDLVVVWQKATDNKIGRQSDMIGADQPTFKAIIDATRKALAAKERPPEGIAAQKAAEEAAAAKAKAAA